MSAQRALGNGVTVSVARIRSMPNNKALGRMLVRTRWAWGPPPRPPRGGQAAGAGDRGERRVV